MAPPSANLQHQGHQSARKMIKTTPRPRDASNCGGAYRNLSPDWRNRGAAGDSWRRRRAKGEGRNGTRVPRRSPRRSYMRERSTGHAGLALSSWPLRRGKAERGRRRHGVKVGDDPLPYRFALGWARDGLGPAGPSLLAGEKRGGAKPCRKKEKNSQERKRRKAEKKKAIKYIKIYSITLEPCLITQNWLHNFGMQRKITQSKTVPFPI